MKGKKIVVEYTEVNGWSINGKPAEEKEVWRTMEGYYKEQRQAIDQFTYLRAVKIEI